MVTLRTVPSFAYLKSAGPYLVLPGLVLLGVVAVLSPDVWGAVYTSAKYCRAYMAEASPFETLPVLGILLVSAPVAIVCFTAAKELFRLRLLTKSIARSEALPPVGPPGQPYFMLEDPRPLAFCHGLLRPRVYFSTGLIRLLTAEELQAVMFHEEVHASRRDPLRVFIARVAAAGLFALPVARLVRDRYLSGLETSADREVVIRLGLAPLATALVKLLSLEPAGQVNAAVSQFNPAKQRVDQLVGAHAARGIPPVPARHLWASAATVAISGLLAAGTIYGVNEFLLATPFCQVPMV